MEEMHMTGVAERLSEILGGLDYDRFFVLTDENTRRDCLPLLGGCREVAEGSLITIPAGDTNKTLESVTAIWQHLTQNGASRKSLLINIGGGMVTDLGGFCAATFKRGIRFINIPTTLLSMVDAAEGGKTGFNFAGLKNEIGVFQKAEAIILDTRFLQTLDEKNILSGYAEMLKHALLKSEAHWAELMTADLLKPQVLQGMVEKSVGIKREIVAQDPLEKGIRKALNLGHTAGHAFESLAMETGQPILHGYAVAWGLVCALYLSCRQAGFNQTRMLQTASFIKENYGVFVFDCKQYDRLHELMRHDKKNTLDKSGKTNFTLLAGFGDIRTDQLITRQEIDDMLDFYRETMGC